MRPFWCYRFRCMRAILVAPEPGRCIRQWETRVVNTTRTTLVLPSAYEGHKMQHAGDILVIDDHPATVEFIADALTDDGYSVRTAPDAARARVAIAELRPDLVLADLHLPGKPGDLLARDLHNDGLADGWDRFLSRQTVQSRRSAALCCGPRSPSGRHEC